LKTPFSPQAARAQSVAANVANPMRAPTWLLSLLMSSILAACGGGGSGVSPISASGATGEGGSATNPPPTEVASLSCDNSIKTNFKPDAQTSVLLVKSYKKGDSFPNAAFDGATTAPNDLCLVKLLVGPGNPGPAGAPSTSPGIGIEVWLPAKDNWNGRLHATGGGGWAGTEEADVNKISSLAVGSDMRSAPTIAGTEGAVTASTDTGHTGGDGSFAMNPDGTINSTLWTDFASRGIHEEVVKAKALATAYYGSAPKRTYWDGGSTGGRQALKQAQMYPEDFDGIIAGFPAINWSRFITAEMYPQIVIQQDLGGNHMSTDQLNLVSNAAIASCDLVGGKHLGYILDPSACRYDPTKDVAVLCTASGGTNASAACMTKAQATAINKIWYGMTSDGSVPDPSIDNGWTTAPSGVQRWYGLTRGTNLAWLAGPTAISVATPQIALELQNSTLAGPYFTNATGNGADGWKDLSYTQLSNAFDRGIALQGAFGNINTDNPDLSAFKARGGKLIQYHGASDIVIFPQGSINYYNRVASSMGGLSAIQDFYRLYIVPGMSHGPGNGTSNPDANPPYPAPGQIYGLLIDWVEKGEAPDSIVVQSPTSTSNPTSQPICVYPKKATYTSGDPFVATSYTCS